MLVEEIRRDALSKEFTDEAIYKKYGLLDAPPVLLATESRGSHEFNSGVTSMWGQTWPNAPDEDDECFFSSLVLDYCSPEEKPSSALVRIVEPKPRMFPLGFFTLKPGTTDFSWVMRPF